MKVIATIQSKIHATEGAEKDPVEMVWYNGDNKFHALTAIASLMDEPDIQYTRTLAVRVEF